MSAPVVSPGRGVRRPWVGRSYAHLVVPQPQLDHDLRRQLDAAMRDVGLEPVDTDEETSMFARRWGYGGGNPLLLTVLGWYPLLFTVGPEAGGTARLRQAKERLVDTVLGLGGRAVSDRDLDRVLGECRTRWAAAVAARRRIEEQRSWLECRRCRACGTWSAYGVLHCRQCARRFAPADDAERDEHGRAAAEVVSAAERELAQLGSGEGLFQDWPVRDG